MNYEKLAIRNNIIRFTYDNYPKIIQEMKSIDHFYENEENPYHLEGSVWTHTLLVLDAILEKKEAIFADYLCAFLHDFGKIKTRSIREKPDGSHHITFFDHGAAGVQMAFDFLLKYKSKYPDAELSDDEIANIIFCVSNHIDFYKIESVDDAFKFCNYDKDLLFMMTLLAYSDFTGSFADPKLDCKLFKLIEDIVDQFDSLEKPINIQSNSYTFNIYCGVPGSGKDYLAGTINKVSFDNTRIRIFREKFNSDNLTSSELYHRAFDYSTTINIDNEFINDIKTLNSKTINICNTNCNRKARRKLYNLLNKSFPNAQYNAIFVLSGTNTIIERDKNRGKDSKTLGISIISKFLNKIEIPNLYSDKYLNSVKIIINKENNTGDSRE